MQNTSFRFNIGNLALFETICNGNLLKIKRNKTKVLLFLWIRCGKLMALGINGTNTTGRSPRRDRPAVGGQPHSTGGPRSSRRTREHAPPALNVCSDFVSRPFWKRCFGRTFRRNLAVVRNLDAPQLLNRHVERARDPDGYIDPRQASVGDLGDGAAPNSYLRPKRSRGEAVVLHQPLEKRGGQFTPLDPC